MEDDIIVIDENPNLPPELDAELRKEAPPKIISMIQKLEPGKWYLNGKPLDDAAQTAIDLAEENTRLKAAISKFCKECIAFFRGSDPAQCRICALGEFKEGKK